MKTKFLLSLMAFSIINLNAFEYSAPKNYPSGELGKLVKLGEQIVLHTNTHPLSRDLVGNSLRCANCHLIGKDENLELLQV
jgi:thiosulfate dehydrogenase